MEKLLLLLVLVVAVAASPVPQKPSTFEAILKANKGSKKWIEGDIVDTPMVRQKMAYSGQAFSKFSGYDAQNSGKWPNGVVPYQFGTIDQAGQSAVKAAIAEYNAKTCVKFVPHTNEADYLIFNKQDGCYSHIGRMGGQQEVSIGKGCERLYVAIHEMMHAIGFFHEQSRRDRDNYITIDYSNIPQDMAINFQMYQQGQATTHNEPYDKQSVMHYDRYAFAMDTSRPTITSNSNPNEELGNKVGFTQNDINQINKHYNCGTNPNTAGPNTMGPLVTNPPYTMGPVVTNPKGKLVCAERESCQYCRDPAQWVVVCECLDYKSYCVDGDVANCPFLVSYCSEDYVRQYCRKSCNSCI